MPGGFSAHATEVEQEGLRLPPVKLFKRGEMDREIFSITRLSEFSHVYGDEPSAVGTVPAGP